MSAVGIGAHLGFCSRARGSAWAGGACTVRMMWGTSLPRLLCARAYKGYSFSTRFHRFVGGYFRRSHDDGDVVEQAKSCQLSNEILVFRLRAG